MPRLRIITGIGLAAWVALIPVGEAWSADLDAGSDELAPRAEFAPSRPDSSRGWGFIDRVCETEVAEVEIYPPAPRYVYDNRRGARWTGNGWVYLPIGEYPDDYARPLVAPPPPHGVNPTEFLNFPCRVLRHLPDYLPGR